MSDLDDEPESDIEIAAPTQTKTTDVATPRGLSKQQREQYLRDRERVDFWRATMGTVVGRREIWAIIGAVDGLHAFNQNFSVSPVGFPDPNAAWYYRGQQDYGLKLYHELSTLVPAEAMQMLAENDARFQTPTAKNARTRKPD